jgi:hypothetical protein
MTEQLTKNELYEIWKEGAVLLFKYYPSMHEVTDERYKKC